MRKKILVRRTKPREIVYIRSYPRDYEEYHESGDYDAIHPNKLKTWVSLSKAAIKSRDKTFEEVIYNIIHETKDKKIKHKIPLYVDEEEYYNLKLQALQKGIDPKYIDVLVRTKKPEKKSYQEVIKVYTKV